MTATTANPDVVALRAVCDTLLPGAASDVASDLADTMRGSASDRGIVERIAAGLPGLPPHVRGAVERLLTNLEAAGFADRTLGERTDALLAAGERGEGRLALKQLKAMTFGDLFGSFDADGRNPMWDAIEYPGPVSKPPSPEQAPKTIPIERVGGGEATLEADVCIVGSGAGGSVLAARLAQAGRSVIVLEAGGYRNESDFRQLEAEGAKMYLGGGLGWSEDGSLGLLAGSTLGGGTVINSMACRPTPQDVREAWAGVGLEGVDGPEWDACAARVWERLGANTEATHYNSNAEILIAGLTACGLAHHRIPRNVELDDDPRMCGYCNAGCQQGCKRSTLRTYLQDAADAGARFVVDCHVQRVLVSGGRARGVEAVVGSEPDATRLNVRAETVIVAAGGIESPALLLRSGIGGPAVGRHLRVHPSYMVTGVYDEPVHAWDGAPITVMSFDFMGCEEGSGFFISPLGLSPSTWAGQSPWSDGQSARDHFLKMPHMASWHSIAHDHGSGQVVLGADGRALVRWRLEDEIDRRLAVRGHVELARVHRAAGAREVFTFHWRPRHWRRGEDFELYLQSLREAPAEDYTAYSAHQMSSCRMGASPAESVADGEGQLHDVQGVWIGDGSALPTAPGVNPMVTIMALAERTALRILDQA